VGDKLMTAGAFVGAFVGFLGLRSPAVTNAQRIFRLSLASTAVLLLVVGAILKFRSRRN
jgi:hypothetical protein